MSVYTPSQLPPWVTGLPVNMPMPRPRIDPNNTNPGMIGLLPPVAPPIRTGLGVGARVNPNVRPPVNPVRPNITYQTQQPVDPNNTNPGMIGLLPQYQEPQFINDNSPTPRFEGNTPAPQYQDDNNILTQLMSQLNGQQSPLRNEYAGIMSQLQGLLNQPQQSYTPYTPEQQQYTQDPELTNAIAMIRQLAESGGYSEEDKSNLRARGVSPIRSVYANAMQDLDRSKALQGGYSPGHVAATSKLTRELADRVAGQTTNVNADIAEKVAQGKMAMAPQLGNITNHMNDLINSISGTNTNARNEAGIFNTKMGFDVGQANTQNKNQVMSMIQSLFGTNADMASRFADQAISAAGLGQRSTENRNNFNMQGWELGQRGADSRNQFNMQNRELNQRGMESRNRNILDASNSRNQFNMQGSELSQQMQQFLQRMGLDREQLNQQGGLGLIQALMQAMQGN